MTDVHLTVTEVRRAGRNFTLTCKHPLVIAAPVTVELPAHVAKQLVGLLIAEEGQNEMRQQQSKVTVVGAN